MENKNEILQELFTISPAVANLGRENTYSVPPGYFETLPSLIMARIRGEDMDFRIKANPFEVPQGYFEGLADNILGRIKLEQTVEEELAEIAPVLKTISKQPVYKIPDGYFESLEISIPLVVAKPKAKVFGMSVRRAVQYAVAACTTAILVVGGLLYSKNDSLSIGETAAISHKEAIKMDLNSALSGVSEDELNQYLDENPTVGYAFTNTSAQEEINVDQYIQQASDEDIEQYLEDAPSMPEKDKDS